MSPEDFAKTMAKLKSTYDEKFYREIREEFFWQTVKDFSASWFDKIVVQWIGSNTKPLLVNEIREAAIKEKSKQIQDEINRPQGHGAMPGSIFTTEDVRMMFNMIKKKNAGLVSDSEWKAFSDWVKTTAAQSTQTKNLSCLDCFDQGYIWRDKEGTDYTLAYRCSCPIGLGKEHYMPVWRKNFKALNSGVIYE